MPFVKKPLDAHVLMDLLPLTLRNEARLKDGVVCDFCGGDDAIYAYAAARMSTGVAQPCWRWCACKGCSGLVDKENWAALMEKLLPRMTAMLTSRLGVEPPRRLVTEAIAAAIKNFCEDAQRAAAA